MVWEILTQKDRDEETRKTSRTYSVVETSQSLKVLATGRELYHVSLECQPGWVSHMCEASTCLLSLWISQPVRGSQHWQTPNLAPIRCCDAQHHNRGEVMGRGGDSGGLKCQKSHGMTAFVGLMVDTPLRSLSSCKKRFPGRFRNRFGMVSCNPKDPALWAGVGMY